MKNGKKTLWHLLLDIFAYIMNRRKNKKDQQKQKQKEQKQNFKNSVEKLQDEYADIDFKKKNKRKSSNVKDISDQLNNRF